MKKNVIVGAITGGLLLLGVVAYLFLPILVPNFLSGKAIVTPTEEVNIETPTDVVPEIITPPKTPGVNWVLVTDVNPSNLATSKDINSNIVVTFSKAMNSATINENTFKVKGDSSNPIVKGIITSDATKKIWTFNPTYNLQYSSEYEVTITTGVRGVSGDYLLNDYMWSFRTKSSGGGGNGGSGSTTTTPTSVLTTITLTPTLKTLNNGSTQQLNATGLDENNVSISATINYTSSNTTVATVNASGFVTALALGNTTITAADGTINDTSIITVVDVGANCSAVTAVVLGASRGYVIIAKTAISDTNPTLSSVTGNITLDPAAGSLITDISCTNVVGTIYDNNAGYTGGHDSNVSCLVTDAVETLAAESAMETAYGSAASAVDYPACITELGSGNIGGMTLAPGVYKWSTGVTIPTDVTLNCGGDTDAVFVFQIAQTLGLSNGIQVRLAGGCQTKNIFWQANTAATLGTTSVFNGNILTGTAITLNSGATLNGRAFAQSAVTIAGSPVTIPI